MNEAGQCNDHRGLLLQCVEAALWRKTTFAREYASDHKRGGSVIPLVDDARMCDMEGREAGGKPDIHPPAIWPWPIEPATDETEASEPQEWRICRSEESRPTQTPLRLRKENQCEPSVKIQHHSNREQGQASPLGYRPKVKWHEERQDYDDETKKILPISHHRWNIPPKLL